MENTNRKSQDIIDLRILFKKIRDNKKLFFKVLPIVFVLSCLFIFSLPRYYQTDTKLAPEMDNLGTTSALSSLASSFGFDIGEMQTTDAITPMLYPDLMDDNGFIAKIINIKVTSKDGEIKASYHDYLKQHQKYAWWHYPILWAIKLLPKKQDEGGGKHGYDPYYLSKKESAILEKARDNIKIAIDKKTGVISIDTKAQDALVCKILADSVKEILQDFITDYRTNKARTDYEYYKSLTDNSKRDYEKTRRLYASISDASTNVSLRSVELKIEDIENDMQLKLNAYTTMNTQMLAAKAKVQERTPAFTVIKGASVPIKPAGPKRMIFVAAMLFLAVLGTAFYIVKEDILSYERH